MPLIKTLVLFLICFFSFFNSYIPFSSMGNYSAGQEENSQPIVKIISPAPNSMHSWNTTARFVVTVSDKEDGESKYQEIPANEVFLKVKYLQDTTALDAYLEKEEAASAGFTALRMSNCFNCHAVKTSLIGPSFQDISRKYPNNNTTAEMLIKRIKDGSSGVWGSAAMPSHPEMTAKQLQDIAQWIMTKSDDPEINYYSGLEGTFQLKPATDILTPGLLVLTASYLDHGLKDTPQQNLEGKNTVIIRVN